MNYIANAFRNEGDPQILESGPSSQTAAGKLARGLGWFSIALGVAELIGARKMARTFGMTGNEGLLRAFGAREIGAGIMTLSTEKTLGLYTRLLGDAMDILALGTAFDAPSHRQRRNARLALLAVGGVTVLDAVAARALTRERARDGVARTYDKRSGFPKGLPSARGSAMHFETPRQFRAALPG